MKLEASLSSAGSAAALRLRALRNRAPCTPSSASPSPDPAHLYWEPEKIIGIKSV